jgi:hypothetical protein
MGFGRIIGGALEGAGAGIAEMAASKELERRNAALENLRSQNTLIEQEDRAVQTDWAASRDLNRRTNSELVIGAQAGEQEAAIKAAERQAEAREAAAERQHDVRMEQIKGQQTRLTDKAKAAIDAGQVQTTFVADSGEVMIVTKAGKTIATGTTATEKDRIYNPNEGSSGSSSVLQDVRGGTAPAPTPTKAPAKSQPPAKPATTPSPALIDGLYRALTDQQAEVFVNDPKNKGKRFMGPDGKTYTVK